jgi:FlaA1/EpsC-like NDP-sugar epimerase
MGATKRLSELHILSYLQNYDKNNLETKFSIVRFGNVIASKGSVLPLFNKQIASGGPITITHPNIERFFMTIPEAVGLVLETCTLVKKIEIYVLDMGKPIKIIDLAKKVINLSGLKIKDSKNTDGDIEIKIIGLRPGEKLFEELFINKNIEKTSHKKITRDNE